MMLEKNSHNNKLLLLSMHLCQTLTELSSSQPRLWPCELSLGEAPARTWEPV